MPDSTQIMHQVERVGPGAPDRLLALRGRVLQEQLRRLDAEIGGDDAHADLDGSGFGMCEITNT